ncbi:MAG: metal ABC transporter permease [Candidatus Sumerlaeaceae bacterium]|nr:metal ABC transporter permease [Candidatus Sumerlaeaceae bacterium]
MTNVQLEIQLVAVLVAVACALPGVYLVLRRAAMLSDAISHSILLGIVLAYFVVRDLSSPLLVIAAAATGVGTVWLVELLVRTRLVRSDAAIGLVFPTLFAVAVILISLYARSLHLDTDSVLLGEIAFAPFNRFEVAGRDLGPLSAWVMGGILLINVAFIALFYKELKLATFDPEFAAAQGFMPAAIRYALMTLVSITAVGAFDAVGSVLVVALMIAPAATALLISHRLGLVLAVAAAVAVWSALSGYWVAHVLDASIAGSMSTMCGIVFLLAYLFSPSTGLVAQVRRRQAVRMTFALKMLAVHLAQHERQPEAATENRAEHLTEHIRWTNDFAEKVVRRALSLGLIGQEDGKLFLTEKGRVLASESVIEDSV